MRMTVKLLDVGELVFTAKKLGVPVAELQEDIVGTSVDKPVKIGFEGPNVGWIRGAEVRDDGIWAELEVEDRIETMLSADADPHHDLAPGMLIGHEDKALKMKFAAAVREAAIVPKRSVSDINFRQ